MAIPSISHDPILLSQNYIGPKVVYKSSRKKPSYYSENQTIAYVPRNLLGITEQSHYSLAVEKLLRKPPVTEDVLSELLEDIQNHFEQRIQLFFQQLLLVYKTELVFKFYNRADDQVGTPDSKHSIATEQQDTYVAAHCSTLPALRIVKENSAIDFAKSSFFKTTWNATVCLPEIVNIVDSALDKSCKCLNEEKTFRYHCTNLLASLAKDKFNPKQGLVYFLNLASYYLQKISVKESDTKKQFVLEAYKKVAADYAIKLKKDDSIIKALSFDFNASRCDDSFYMNIQTHMHRLLIREMEVYRLEYFSFSSTIGHLSNQDAARFKPIIKEFNAQQLQEGSLHFSKKALEYANFCSTAESLCQVAYHYFSQVNDEDRLREDLTVILEMTSMQKNQLSERIVTLYEKVKNGICKEYKVSRICHMNIILLKFLEDVK